jgi:hypothetical protein
VQVVDYSDGEGRFSSMTAAWTGKIANLLVEGLRFRSILVIFPVSISFF